MTDADWKAALYLKSGLKTGPITVTPTLFLSNGQRYPLSPVTLDPSGTAIVDIGQALESVGIAPYATLCGYAEIEYQWPWAAVSATVKNVDVVNSLIYIFGLQPSPDWHPDHPESFPARLPSSFEGLWWKQEKDVSGFLALSNVTGQAIHASVRLTGKSDSQLASYQVTVSPHGTKMIILDELKAAADDTGGIYLTHDGPERGLDINGGLQDKGPGYSARLQMWPQPQPSSASQPQSPQTLSISELGLMTGASDPMMNFPYGTIFTPYSLVRNISEQPVTVTPELWWMSGGSPHSSTLPQMLLSPHQTVNLNAPALLAAAGLKDFNGSVNLILDTKAQAGGLLMSSGSVDQKNTYVFEVMPHGVVEGAAKELCYWSTGNGDDTMVTLWNPADEPQDLSFTLFFTGGQYIYPIHLGPRETRTMNVSDIVHISIPDAAGNVIPAGLTEGSAEIAGSQGEQQQILVSLDVAVYNVRKATCGTVCWECDGIVYAAIDLSPFAVAVAGTTGETFYETSNTGYQYGASASWRSSSTSIATVNTTGVVTGVRTGSLTLYANDLYAETDGVGWYCTDMYFYCPTSNFSGSAPGNAINLKILRGGSNGTDITNTTQSVVPGQQIALYGSYTPPSGTSVSSQSWSPDSGSTILGGYSPSSASATVETAQTNSQSTTFYWATPGTSVLTFGVHFSNGAYASAHTTYNISGPSPSAPTITLPTNGQLFVNTLTGCTDVPGGQFLDFGNLSGAAPGCGNPSGLAGIQFSPPTTQSPPGTFFFVQLIKSDTTTYSRTGATMTCSTVSGLDRDYPFQNKTAQLVNDAPEAPLPSTFTTATRSFSATMYLMWQSSTSGSIPVPLDYVDWQFSGSANEPQQNSTWGSPTGSGSVGSLVTINSPGLFPTWQGPAVQNCQ